MTGETDEKLWDMELRHRLKEMWDYEPWQIYQMVSLDGPEFTMLAVDAEGDQVCIEFSGDGDATIRTEKLSYVMFGSDQLQMLADAAEQVEVMWERFWETDFGKDLAKLHDEQQKDYHAEVERIRRKYKSRLGRRVPA